MSVAVVGNNPRKCFDALLTFQSGEAQKLLLLKITKDEQ